MTFMQTANIEAIMYGILFILFVVEAMTYSTHRLNKESLKELVSNIGVIFLHNLGKYIFLPPLVRIYNLLLKYKFFDIPWSFWGFLLSLVLIDFIYYIYHWCMHRFDIMWAVHAVHHQPRFVNLSMATRLSFFNKAITYWFYLPLAFLGIPPSLLFAAGLVDAFYQAITHSRTWRLPSFFRKFLIDSRDHHLHHGRTANLFNLNYGGMFAFWDHIFGTHALKRDSDQIDQEFLLGKVQYGLNEVDGSPGVVNNPIWANVQPFYKMLIKRDI